jgi:predicted Na+-dependent transporter
MGGAEKGNRRVLAIATNMRNAGLCLIVAMRMFPESGADVAVIAFMGLMVPPNMLFTVYHTIKERRREKRGLRTKGPSD